MSRKAILLLVLPTAITGISATILFFWAKTREIQTLVFVIAIVLCVISFFAIQLLDSQNYWGNLGILVGFGITVIGWFFSSYMSNQDAVQNARRELRIKYLTDAYIRMSNAQFRETEPLKATLIYAKYVEPAVDVVSLLGDTLLIRKMNMFALTPCTKDSFTVWENRYLAALYELRYDLRTELGLTLLDRQRDTAHGPYNINFYRRFATDTMRKVDPTYDDLEIEMAKEALNHMIGH